MTESPHFEDNATAVIVLLKDWSSSSAVSIARQHPAFVVVEVSGTAELGILEKIAQLSLLGVRVIAIVEADRELEELCTRAGATSVIREDRPVQALVAIVERAHRSRGAKRDPARRRHDDYEPSEKSLALLALLTRQEQKVLAALMQGQAVRQIASSNVLSPLTVRSHVRSILQKLGVNSQLAAVALAHRNGWRPDTLAGSGRR